VVLVTYAGTVTAELDLEEPHPFLLQLSEGDLLRKVDVLAAFSETDSGAALGRMKRAPEVREPAAGPEPDARRHLRRDALRAAVSEGRRVRFLLRDGRGVTGIPRRATRYEYLVEIKGGTRLAIFHHALVGAIPEKRPEEVTPDEGGGGKRGRKRKKGRKGKKRRKG